MDKGTLDYKKYKIAGEDFSVGFGSSLATGHVLNSKDSLAVGAPLASVKKPGDKRPMLDAGRVFIYYKVLYMHLFF